MHDPESHRDVEILASLRRLRRWRWLTLTPIPAFGVLVAGAILERTCGDASAWLRALLSFVMIAGMMLFFVSVPLMIFGAVSAHRTLCPCCGKSFHAGCIIGIPYLDRSAKGCSCCRLKLDGSNLADAQVRAQEVEANDKADGGSTPHPTGQEA
jgi:hypothetical protein